ncbi:Tim44-like domain-containing protein [Betaproteobacteria bacterium]|nr:Tim44-like domain-containing protein [Betaproteobacteria bacterium]
MAGLTLNKPNKFFVSFFLISFFSLLALESSEARRMGGGRSFGKMPPIKRQATTPQKPAEKVSPKNSPNSVASNRGGMGMLGGLAAGLGLAALASYLGIGGELMGLLVILGICFLCFLAFRVFFSKGLARMALAGGSPEKFPQTRIEERLETTTAGVSEKEQYSDANFEWEIPEKEKFLEVAKSKFIELQKHWSSGDLAKLENFCTEGLMEHLSKEFREEDRVYSNLSVVELNAYLEGNNSIKKQSGVTVSEVYIRFNGLMRDSDSLPIKFNEVWTLQKTNNPNQGWLLAGIFQDKQLD